MKPNGRGRGWRAECRVEWRCPVCRRELSLKPSDAKRRKTCSMKCRERRVQWRCSVCGITKHLLPSDAKRRQMCSLACRNKATAGNTKATENRLKRVMFVKGYSREKATGYIHGWKDARAAALRSYMRGIKLRTQRIGSEAWERQQEIAQ